MVRPQDPLTALLLILGTRRGDVADGLVIGIATGMGYAFVTLIGSHGNIGDSTR